MGLKVLHILSYRGWTGCSQFCLQLSRGLQDLGHSVTIACSPRGELWQRAEALRISTLPVRVGGQLDPRRVWQFRQAMAGDSFDVVHVMTSRDYLAGCLVARWLGVKAIVLSRHLTFPVRWHIRLVYDLPDVIVAASEAVRRILIQSDVPASKVLTIHYGIDLKGFPAGPDVCQRVRQELGISEEQLLCILVGRLASGKGHIYYLRAAQQILKGFPNAFFLVVGDGKLKAPLQEECARLGIAERVLFTGFSRNVPELLSAADVSVVPSVWEEAFPYVLLESMAAARPVVAFAVGGIPEIVEDGVTGFLVEPRRADLLAEAIAQLLADPHLRRCMGERGRQRIERDFTVERMGQDYENLYRRLCR